MIELGWLIGAATGFLIGCVHAVDIYRRCDRLAVGGRLRGRTRALYHGAWTLALWTLFGAYVLVVWLLGLVLYVAAGCPSPAVADTSPDRSP